MAKIRTDSWAAALTEDQQWELYARSKQRGPWTVPAQWAVKEYGIAMPSQSGFYRWRNAMRASEHDHHMEQAAIAAAEAAALGGKATKDEALVSAFKALATEAALETDAKTAIAFVQSAVAIHDRIIKQRELELKSRAQTTKEADLALAREKFEAAEKRLNAASSAVSDDKLSDAERVAKIKSIFGIS